MPRILPQLPLVTLPLVAGEWLLDGRPVPRTDGAASPLAPLALPLPVAVPGMETFAPLGQGEPLPTARTLVGSITANGGVICTGTGEWVPLVRVPVVMPADSTTRWYLTGTTRDSTGVALGSCRVIVLEVGRLAVTGAPVVAETVSDGSGAYSVEVPMCTAYQVLSYKTGSPDVTGASLQTITPTAG